MTNSNLSNDHYYLSHQFIRVAYDSCYGANRVGHLVKNLGFEALNIGLKTNKLKTNAQTFSAIAKEVVDLTKNFEKNTEEYLSETAVFVGILLDYLKRSRRFRYYTELSQNNILMGKSEASSTQMDFIKKAIETFTLELNANKKNIFETYHKLHRICQQLLSLVSSERYAVNLATIEVSRDAEQIEIILPSLKMILGLIESIHKEIESMRDSLERMGTLFANY